MPRERPGYDFSSALHAEALYTLWDNDAERTGASILRDTAGNPATSGLVAINDIRCSIPAGSYAPRNVEEARGMLEEVELGRTQDMSDQPHLVVMPSDSFRVVTIAIDAIGDAPAVKLMRTELKSVRLTTDA